MKHFFQYSFFLGKNSAKVANFNSKFVENISWRRFSFPVPESYLTFFILLIYYHLSFPLLSGIYFVQYIHLVSSKKKFALKLNYNNIIHKLIWMYGIKFIKQILNFNKNATILKTVLFYWCTHIYIYFAYETIFTERSLNFTMLHTHKYM